MITIGLFSEMKLYADNGSIQEHIVDKVDYDKNMVIEYLSNQKRIAGCPKTVFDCITGEKISDSFFVYNDGEYEWCDFLIYYIKKYNIALPKCFIDKIINKREK